VKNFQQNILILLALCLCSLCVYQWYLQMQQRNQIEKLNQTVYEKSMAVQNCTNSIATMDHQIAELSSRIAELRQTAQTNEQAIATQRREINKLEVTGESLTNQIGEYKKAVGTLEARLKDAYDGIKKQNEALQELATQRDEFVKKYNDSVKDRNEVVTKYNDLAERVQKLQAK